MITRGNERFRQAMKNRAAVVLNLARFSVHQFRRANHAPAKGSANRLMSQAHAQNRNLSRESLDQRDADARFPRRARPRRNHDTLWREFFNLIQRNLVVATT